MNARSGRHAFAFQNGYWRVRHRRLARRLVGDTTWIEFGGTCHAFEVLGGAGNVDDFVIEDPAGTYFASTFRRLEPGSDEWSIHWADSRQAGLAPPMRGRFENGVGTFYGDDVLDGAPVRVRFVWSELDATHARWEQAFSRDGSAWEVNWVMRFDRMSGAEAI